MSVLRTRTAIVAALVALLGGAAAAFPQSTAAPRKVTFTAEDGMPLAADFVAAPNPGTASVILLHMYQNNRRSYDPLVPVLARTELNVLALDMRGHGESRNGKDGKPIPIGRETTKDPATNPFLLMHKDVEAAMDFLTKNGAAKDVFAIVGASVGCSVALHAASLDPGRVRALVLLTPGKDYLDVPSLEHVKSFLPRPVLILTSEEEAGLGSRDLSAALPPGSATLRVFPETDIHGTRMFGRVSGVEPLIADFVKDALRGAAGTSTVPPARLVLADGRIDESEYKDALRFAVPLSSEDPAAHPEAVFHVALKGERLVVAAEVPGRAASRNEVQVFLDPSGKGGDTLSEGDVRITFAPGTSAGKRRLEVAHAKGKSWVIDNDSTGVEALGEAPSKDRWTAEIFLDTSRFLPGDSRKLFRMGFVVKAAPGAGTYPPNPALPDTPTLWRPFSLDSPK